MRGEKRQEWKEEKGRKETGVRGRRRKLEKGEKSEGRGEGEVKDDKRGEVR